MNLHDIKPIAISLMLDKSRTLKFHLNPFAELEEVYGSVERTFAAMQSNSMKAARTLLWVGLPHEDENLTPCNQDIQNIKYRQHCHHSRKPLQTTGVR